MKTSGEKAIERGDSKVAKIVELISIRNDFVHPKRKALDADACIDMDAPEGIKFNFEYGDGGKGELKMPVVGLHWDCYDAKRAVKATFEFFDYLFRELLEMGSGDIYHLFGNRMAPKLGEEATFIASGPIEEYEELLVWAKDNKLPTGFLLDA